MKTALVIGATGLVGNHITKKLLDNNNYSKVKVFVRRSIGFQHPKLEEHLVDFEFLKNWRVDLTGDELYSALGTTIKKAGSKISQFKIDYTYQYEVACAASDNGIKKYLLISSIGANHKSKNFYLSIKGKLEEDNQKLAFEKIFIFRPSFLAGERGEKRIAESIGIKIAGATTKVIPALHKYHPVEAEKVAEFMIKTANKNFEERIKIFESDEILNG